MLNTYILLVLCLLIALDILTHISSMILSYHVRKSLKVAKAAIESMNRKDNAK